MLDPLAQFSIYPTFKSPNTPYSLLAFLNTASFSLLVVGSFLIFQFCNYGTIKALSGPTFVFQQFHDMGRLSIMKNWKPKRRTVYAAYLFLFLVVVVCNLFGMLPYSLTLTSSFAVTFCIALWHFLTINYHLLWRRGPKSPAIFVPSGAPNSILPMLILIEIVSYCARVFSLSIRLFANMLAGHALMKILIGFSWQMLAARSVLFTVVSLFPWIAVSIITVLELVIAILQAYVLTTLISLYSADA